MYTGHHAAVSAGVKPGDTVAAMLDRRATKSLVRISAGQ